MSRRSSRSAVASSSASASDDLVMKDETMMDTSEDASVVKEAKKQSTPAKKTAGVKRRASTSRTRRRVKKEKEEEEEEDDNDGNDEVDVEHEDDEDNVAADEYEERKESKPAARNKRAKKSQHVAAAAAASSSSSPHQIKQEDDGDGGDDDEEDADEPAADDIESLAAAAGVSVYEYQRQQNIRLKNEQLQRLNLTGLSSEIGLKRTAAPRATSARKPKGEPTVGVRKSLRARSLPAPPIYVPDADFSTSATGGLYDRARKEGVLKIVDKETLPSEVDLADANTKKRYDSVLGTFKSALCLDDKRTAPLQKKALAASYQQPNCLSLTKLKMMGNPNNSAELKVVKDRATVIKVHPTVSLTSDYSIVAASDKMGRVGLARYSNLFSSAWSETIQVAQYCPHVNSVVELLWSVNSSHLLYSAARDGSVRRLDITQERFDEVFVEDEKDGANVSGMGLSPSHETVLVGDRAGVVHLVDARTCKLEKTRYRVGTKAVNSCVINPQDERMLVTAGLDREVRAWDTRYMKVDKPVKEWTHAEAINSAVFSDSGKMLCSTSYDNTMKIWSCVSSDGSPLSADSWLQPTIMRHDNHTGRWVSRFKAHFAPEGIALAVGNMKRPIDVQLLGEPKGNGKTSTAAASSSSSSRKKNGNSDSPVPPPTLGSLLCLHHGEWVTTIPAAVAWHPTRVQAVGCTGSGRLYVYGEHTTAKK